MVDFDHRQLYHINSYTLKWLGMFRLFCWPEQLLSSVLILLTEKQQNLRMSTPFDRLRKTIDNVTIQYRAADYLSNKMPSQSVEAGGCGGGCGCGCTDAAPNNVPQKIIYFTEEEMKKIINLYENEKCKLINLKEKHCQQVRSLNQQLERCNISNKGLMDENEKLSLKLSELIKLEDKFTFLSKSTSEKDRLNKQEIERINSILQDISKELNQQRSKRKSYQEKNSQLAVQLQKLKENSKRNEETLQKELLAQKTHNQEAKKIIEYQILMKSKELNQLHDEYEKQLINKDNIIRDREKYISQLEGNLTAEKDISFKLGQAIKNYQITVLNLSRENQQRMEDKEQIKLEFTARFQELNTEIVRLSNIEHRVFELETELQQERCKQKYHIVEVKDNSKDIQLEVIRRQLKELVQQKALFEARLKKMCKCRTTKPTDSKQTLVQYDNKPKLEEYLKTHEILLRKEG